MNNNQLPLHLLHDGHVSGGLPVIQGEILREAAKIIASGAGTITIDSSEFRVEHYLHYGAARCRITCQTGGACECLLVTTGDNDIPWRDYRLYVQLMRSQFGRGNAPAVLSKPFPPPWLAAYCVQEFRDGKALYFLLAALAQAFLERFVGPDR